MVCKKSSRVLQTLFTQSKRYVYENSQNLRTSFVILLKFKDVTFPSLTTCHGFQSLLLRVQERLYTTFLRHLKNQSVQRVRSEMYKVFSVHKKRGIKKLGLHKNPFKPGIQRLSK